MEMMQQLMAVSGVVVLLAGSLWWLRRRGLAHYGPPGSSTRALQTTERVAMGPQHSLHLVRLAGRGLLVSVSPSGCALLDSFDWTAIENRRPADDPPSGAR